MQGFFVHTSDNGLVGTTNAVRVDNTASVYYKKESEKQIIRLKAYQAESSENADETAIYFDNNASNQFNKSLDAYKLMNAGEAQPNFYSVKSNKEKLAINAQPLINENEIVVPLTLSVKQTGEYIINASEIKNLPANAQVYIFDMLTGKSQNLSLNPEFRVNLNSNLAEGRLYLKINHQASSTDMSGEALFNAFVSNDNINISLSNQKSANNYINIYNAIGQNVFNCKLSSDKSQISAKNLSKGVYIIKCTSDNKTFTEKINVN